MKWKAGVIFMIGVLCISVVFPVLQVQAEEEAQVDNLQLYAQSAVLMDGESGRILFEKDGGEERPMASTTKIMTCILALETGNLNDIVTVSKEAARQPEVHLGMKEGDQFYMEDLLYSIMLESHNDSAWAVAEHISGTVDEFTSLMDQKAKKLGCNHTNFVTPNGLDGKDEDGIHHTTAKDLARIMRYCIMESPQKEAFLRITQTKTKTFQDTTGKKQFTCSNHNAFLDMMEGALTGKTGFTGEAGYCYAGAVRQGDKTLIVTLLACGWPNNKSWKWHDARILYEYGLENYEKRDIYQKAELPELPVLEGIRDTAALTESQAEISLLLGSTDEVRTELSLAENLNAPVEAGMTVGWQNYYVNGELYTSFPIRTAEAVAQRTYRYCLEEILKLIWL